MTLDEFGGKLSARGTQNRHRYAIHICGDSEPSLKAAFELCSGTNGLYHILYGSPQPTSRSFGFICLNNTKAARQYLGYELDSVVIDCHQVVDPDAIGILSGCIRSGGFMIFLTPPLLEWSCNAETLLTQENHNTSAYLRRFTGILTSCQQLIRISADKVAQSELPKPLPLSASTANYSEQRIAIDAMKTFKSQTGPIILESDRGRGKSAAFGIAAQELVLEKGYQIGVTSHGRRSTETLFNHTLKDLPAIGKKIRYFSPDQLLKTQQNIDLLLVDEAATLPLFILTKLLNRYPKIAFASTIHGYEGTGKGFSTRFHQTLNQLKPNWQRIKLEQPIRWGRNDPLEALINRLLLLDAEPTSCFEQKPIISVFFIEYGPVRLIEDEDKLRNLYAILARAHYRTTPSDLMRILDGDDMRLYGLEDQSGNILSVALITNEGQLPEELVEQIATNQRRPKNNLLPVALCTQLGFCEALTMRVARIIRIAVNPNVAGQSYGKQLLSNIINCLEVNFDLIGASFGLDSPLYEFWMGSGFSLVRIGVRKNRSTGTHSGLVICGLSEQGKNLTRDAKNRFARNLPSQIPLYFQDVDRQLLARISEINPDLPLSDFLTSQDYADLHSFASGHCNPDRVSAALDRFAKKISELEVLGLGDADREFIHNRLVLHHPWSAIYRSSQSNKPFSKREGLKNLRRIVLNSLDDLANKG